MGLTDEQIRHDDFQATKQLNFETMVRILHSISMKTVDDLPELKELQRTLDGVNI